MSDFDPDMTYWQSLKIVTKGLLTSSPVRSDDLDDICEATTALGYTVGGILLRILVLVLLPISAPLLTWVVQLNRKMEAERRAKNDLED